METHLTILQGSYADVHLLENGSTCHRSSKARCFGIWMRKFNQSLQTSPKGRKTSRSSKHWFITRVSPLEDMSANNLKSLKGLWLIGTTVSDFSTAYGILRWDADKKQSKRPTRKHSNGYFILINQVNQSLAGQALLNGSRVVKALIGSVVKRDPENRHY